MSLKTSLALRAVVKAMKFERDGYGVTPSIRCMAANIRAQSGAAISRAQLIRALLDAVADADLDLTMSTSETDLKATILARLGKYRL